MSNYTACTAVQLHRVDASGTSGAFFSAPSEEARNAVPTPASRRFITSIVCSGYCLELGHGKARAAIRVVHGVLASVLPLYLIELQDNLEDVKAPGRSDDQCYEHGQRELQQVWLPIAALACEVRNDLHSAVKSVLPGEADEDGERFDHAPRALVRHFPGLLHVLNEVQDADEREGHEGNHQCQDRVKHRGVRIHSEPQNAQKPEELPVEHVEEAPGEAHGKERLDDEVPAQQVLPEVVCGMNAVMLHLNRLHGVAVSLEPHHEDGDGGKGDANDQQDDRDVYWMTDFVMPGRLVGVATAARQNEDDALYQQERKAEAS
mmetsp:Transcript_69896/g.226031  ORF Transcript_69896/g.226031 Transcript_69896/m.226031 type:complete len:319 (+) Transcript_69896:56-1012(+)